MRILFSPVGNTDPVATNNYKEGSLLHICRQYKPELIYLYMSNEILDLHEFDNRYIELLQVLYDDLGLELNYEIIERRELVDAHKFDYFYKDFREILDSIHNNHPKDELLLNISSGTPAMKNALFVLTAISNYKMIPIQVASPQKGGNYRQKEYDVELVKLAIQEVTDPKNKFEDRTMLPRMEYFNYELKKEIINNHLREYNYPAAYTVAKTITEFLPKRAAHLIEAANYRFELNTNDMNRVLKEIEERFFMHRGKQFHIDIVEYILYVDILQKRNLTLEFIRALSPVIFELFKEVLRKQGFPMERLLIEDKYGIIRWDEKELEKPENNEVLSSLMDLPFEINFRSPVSSEHLNKIIVDTIDNEKQAKNADVLRNIERKVRNQVAHQMVQLNKKDLKKRSGKSSEEIVGLLKELMAYVDPKLDPHIWESYELMNQKIISSY